MSLTRYVFHLILFRYRLMIFMVIFPQSAFFIGKDLLSSKFAANNFNRAY